MFILFIFTLYFQYFPWLHLDFARAANPPVVHTWTEAPTPENRGLVLIARDAVSNRGAKVQSSSIAGIPALYEVNRVNKKDVWNDASDTIEEMVGTCLEQSTEGNPCTISFNDPSESHVQVIEFKRAFLLNFKADLKSRVIVAGYRDGFKRRNGDFPGLHYVVIRIDDLELGDGSFSKGSAVLESKIPQRDNPVTITFQDPEFVRMLPGVHNVNGGPIETGNYEASVKLNSIEHDQIVLREIQHDNSFQFIAFQLNTGPVKNTDGKKYTGVPDERKDFNARLAILREALKQAAASDSIAPHSLKIMVLPEFYFRGNTGAYSESFWTNTEQGISTALEKLFNFKANDANGRQVKWGGWMVVVPVVIRRDRNVQLTFAVKFRTTGRCETRLTFEQCEQMMEAWDVKRADVEDGKVKRYFRSSVDGQFSLNMTPLENLPPGCILVWNGVEVSNDGLREINNRGLKLQTWLFNEPAEPPSTNECSKTFPCICRRSDGEQGGNLQDTITSVWNMAVVVKGGADTISHPSVEGSQGTVTDIKRKYYVHKRLKSAIDFIPQKDLESNIDTGSVLVDENVMHGDLPNPKMDATMNNVVETFGYTFGFEVCMDHGFAVLSNLNEDTKHKSRVDVQLTASGGMDYQEHAIFIKNNGFTFGVDGLDQEDNYAYWKKGAGKKEIAIAKKIDFPKQFDTRIHALKTNLKFSEWFQTEDYPPQVVIYEPTTKVGGVDTRLPYSYPVVKGPLDCDNVCKDQCTRSEPFNTMDNIRKTIEENNKKQGYERKQISYVSGCVHKDTSKLVAAKTCLTTETQCFAYMPLAEYEVDSEAKKVASKRMGEATDLDNSFLLYYSMLVTFAIVLLVLCKIIGRKRENSDSYAPLLEEDEV